MRNSKRRTKQANEVVWRNSRLRIWPFVVSGLSIAAPILGELLGYRVYFGVACIFAVGPTLLLWSELNIKAIHREYQSRRRVRWSVLWRVGLPIVVAFVMWLFWLGIAEVREGDAREIERLGELVARIERSIQEPEQGDVVAPSIAAPELRPRESTEVKHPLNLDSTEAHIKSGRQLHQFELDGEEYVAATLAEIVRPLWGMTNVQVDRETEHFIGKNYIVSGTVGNVVRVTGTGEFDGALVLEAPLSEPQVTVWLAEQEMAIFERLNVGESVVVLCRILRVDKLELDLQALSVVAAELKTM